MDKYIKSSSFNMIHLCVDEYRDYQIIGRAYNNTIKEEIIFKDIPELILKVDEIFDHNGNPISSQEKRTFKKEKEEIIYCYKPNILNKYSKYYNMKGKKGTFDIVVKTRFCSAWQGIIFFEGKEEKFDGVLDLVKKIMVFLQI